MTMVSVRLGDAEISDLDAWAIRLGVDRSDLLRTAIRRHLIRLAAEGEAVAWSALPLSDSEASLADVAVWGPAEDWADWADAAG